MTTAQPRGSGTTYYGWYIVLTAMFIAAVTTGARNGFGVFVLPMSEAFDWSRTTISVAAALGWLVNGVTQPLMGHLFDRYNSRRVILISLVVAGVSTAALSLTFHILFLIFLFSFVLSTAMSGASIGTLAPLLARWFQRRRTTVLGLVVAGSSLGGLILIPFSAYLVELTNWKTSWIVLGLIITALAVPLGFIFLKNRPSDLGLEPDGDPTTVNSSTERRRGLFEVDEWWRSFGSRPMWHLSAAYTVCGVTVGIISIHFVPYAQEQVGVSATTAGLIFGYMMGLNVVGAIGGGFLADRFGRKNVLGAVYFVRGLAYVALLAGLVAVERNIVITLPMGWGDIAWLAWMGSPGLLSLWVFATLAGFSWIASVPVTTSLTADVYGLRALGAISGISFLCHQVGAFASITLAGVLYDQTQSYFLPFTIAGALLFPAALAAFTINERKYSVRYEAASAAAGD